MPTIKTYGLLRSGTNYIRALFEWNTDAKVIFSTVGGWKHGLPEILDIPVLYLVKDPFALMVSLFNYSGPTMQHSKQWGDFLRGRMAIGDGDQILTFENPVDYWNTMTGNYLNASGEDALVLKYEYVLEDPERVVSELSEEFGLTVKPEFKVPENRMRRMGDAGSEAYMINKPFDAGYYIDKRYLDQYSREDRGFMWDNLDVGLVEALDY